MELGGLYKGKAGADIEQKALHTGAIYHNIVVTNFSIRGMIYGQNDKSGCGDHP